MNYWIFHWYSSLRCAGCRISHESELGWEKGGGVKLNGWFQESCSLKGTAGRHRAILMLGLSPVALPPLRLPVLALVRKDSSFFFFKSQLTNHSEREPPRQLHLKKPPPETCTHALCLISASCLFPPKYFHIHGFHFSKYSGCFKICLSFLESP